MFYHCINPEFTWEFAMQFFPKITTYAGLNTMYQYAQLADQESFEADAVEMYNTNNIVQSF